MKSRITTELVIKIENSNSFQLLNFNFKNTLDYIELDEFNQLIDETELDNFQGTKIHVTYGNTPLEIRK